jgi:uncharacterized membrane protein (DUF485 family)
VEKFKEIAGWTFIVAYMLLLIFQGGALMVAAVQETWPDEFAAHEIVTFGMWMGMGLMVLGVASVVPFMVYRGLTYQDEFDQLQEEADDTGGEEPVVEYESAEGRGEKEGEEHS